MRRHVAADLKALALLDSPGFFAGDPYPVYARLRAEAPVYWYEPGDFWAVTTHAGVSAVSSGHRAFSVSRQGTRLADRRGSRRPVAGARPVFTTDPPEHSEFRRVISRAFTPRRMAGIEVSVREIAGELLADVEKEVPVNFVTAVAEPLPIFVIGEMLGLPRADWGQLKHWTDVRVAILDTEPETPEHARLTGDLAEYFEYLRAVLSDRERSPRDDLTSVIASQSWMSVPDRVQMLNSLVVAGNETTRSALSCAAAMLAELPGEWRKLAAAPAGLSRTATEEVLRWATPVVHFARTAMGDIELGGEQICDGDFVVMIYPSANRDPEVWADPESFDVSRPIKPHLSFGTGIHVCLGAALARMEIQIVLEELVSRFGSWAPAGDVERVSSVHVNQYRQVPIEARRN
jgi:cytochrome P450